LEMNGLMGGLYRICEWIMRFSVINVLWVICSIPFLLAALPVLTVENTGQLTMVLIISGVIAPFVLFPATAAMFTVARKWVLGDVDVPLFKTYFRGYKENYRQSMFGGIIYSLLFLLFVVNMRFYAELTNSLQFLSVMFLVLIAVLCVSLFHFFSILSHLHMSVFQIIKSSLLITIGRPLTSIMIAITSAVILYISFFHFQWLLMFFSGSLIAYSSFFYFHRMFVKLQEKQRQWQENAANDEEGDAEKADGEDGEGRKTRADGEDVAEDGDGGSRDGLRTQT
jgi:Predicted integral membrane protein